VKVNFLKSAFPSERGIKHVEGARVPTRGSRKTLKDISPLTNYSPNIAFERYALMRVEKV
jgi:hypothetical protein